MGKIAGNCLIIPFGVTPEAIAKDSALREKIEGLRPQASTRRRHIKKDISESSSAFYSGVNEAITDIDFWGTFDRIEIVALYALYKIDESSPFFDHRTPVIGTHWIERIFSWVIAGFITAISFFGAYRKRDEAKKESEDVLPSGSEPQPLSPLFTKLKNLGKSDNETDNEISELDIEKLNKYLKRGLRSSIFVNKIGNSNNEIKSAKFCRLDDNRIVLIVEDDKTQATANNQDHYNFVKRWFDHGLNFFSLPALTVLWDVYIFSFLILGIVGITTLLNSVALSIFLWVALPIIVGPAARYGKQMFNWLQERHPPSKNKLIAWINWLCFKNLATKNTAINFIFDIFITPLIRAPLGFVLCVVGIPLYYLIYQPFAKILTKLRAKQEVDPNQYQRLEEDPQQDTLIGNEINDQHAAKIKELLKYVEQQLQIEQQINDEFPVDTTKSVQEMSNDLSNKTAVLNRSNWHIGLMTTASAFFAMMSAFTIAQMGFIYWHLFFTVSQVGWATAMVTATAATFCIAACVAAIVIATIRGVFIAIDSVKKFNEAKELQVKNNAAIEYLFTNNNPDLSKAVDPDINLKRRKIYAYLTRAKPSDEHWYDKFIRIRKISGPSQSLIFVARTIFLPGTAYTIGAWLTVAALGGPIAAVLMILGLLTFSIVTKYFQNKAETELEEAKALAQDILACEEYMKEPEKSVELSAQQEETVAESPEATAGFLDGIAKFITCGSFANKPPRKPASEGHAEEVEMSDDFGRYHTLGSGEVTA